MDILIISPFGYFTFDFKRGPQEFWVFFFFFMNFYPQALAKGVHTC